MNDTNYSRRREDDGKVRNLFEQGDMGYKPGGKFPYVDCSTDRGKVWCMVEGRNREEHKKIMADWAAEAQDAQPNIFRFKEYNPKKLDGIRKHEQWSRGVADVSMDDPYIAPRDITNEEYHDLFRAVALANRHGYILDVQVDLTWSQMGFVKDREATSALSRFLKNFAEWCAYRSVGCAWIYVNEVGPKVGLHTHLLTSVPIKHRAEFLAWVKKTLAKFSRVVPMPSTVVNVSSRPSNQIDRQWRSFQYLCKGVSPYAAMKAANGDNIFLSDLNRRAYECPGQMSCKRIGISTNLSPTRVKKLGFRSALDQGVADVRQLYSDKEYSEWHRTKTFSVAEVIASLNWALSLPSDDPDGES